MVIIKEKLPEVRKFCSIWTSCLKVIWRKVRKITTFSGFQVPRYVDKWTNKVEQTTFMLTCPPVLLTVGSNFPVRKLPKLHTNFDMYFKNP